MARIPKPSGRERERGIRPADEFRRGSRGMPQRARILIVCEGEKTEPTYIRALCKDKGLSAVEVEVCGPELGPHPRSVVECAVQKSKEAKLRRDSYSEVWCVFDRDAHERIEEARDRAQARKFSVAYSVPCFEMWYLLHYRYSSAYIERDDACRELEQYLRRPYEKADNPYPDLLDRQAAAMQHAAQLRQDHSSADKPESSNPSTTVDLLVRRLNGLATR